MPIHVFHLDERSPFDREEVLTVGALRPELFVQLLDGNKPVDLSGATVAFSMDSEADVNKVNAAAGVLVDPPNGIVKYVWASGNTDTEGLFFGQFVITKSAKAWFVPNNRSQRLSIRIAAKIN